MSQSSRLQFPYLASGQAQKHVTVNESLLRLDALVQLSARSATTSAQPASPTDGDIYLLPDGKTGAAWDDFADGALAYWRDGIWEELTPQPGWRCLVEDEGALYAHHGGAWIRLAADGERRLLFTPGGDGVVSIYRIDSARVQNPRTATLSAVSGDTLTLTTIDAGLMFNNALMNGVCYARIWNTTKSPDESAWVKAQPASNQLQVLNAASISTWSNGDTIQIGDPTDQTPGRVMAFDISPMMQTVLGRVFRQKGVLLKATVEGVSVLAQLDTTEAGVSGSFSGVRSESGGARMGGQYSQSCSLPSPVSNSNLVLVREAASGAGMALTALSVVGLWV